MKVRRRTSAAFDVSRLFAWFRPRAWLAAVRRSRTGSDHWLDRIDSVSLEDAPVSTAPHAPSAPAPDPASGPLPVPPSPDPAARAGRLHQWWAMVKRRPVPWILGSAFGGTAMAGYLFAALVMFPAPFFTSTLSVPELIGLTDDDANELLQERGLPVGEVTHETHDRAPAGQVIWQEPPANARVSELTTIQLVVSNGPRRIPVPDVSGFENTLARQLIQAAGLTIGRVETVQTAIPRNVVVNTRPAPGATLLPGAGVTLVLSVGAPTILVPDLMGLTREEAQDSLEARGLELGDFHRETNSRYPEGAIIEQRPAAGTLIAPGTSIYVVISRRP